MIGGVAAAGVLALRLLGASAPCDVQPPQPFLVSVSWLAQHRSDPGMVVLAVDQPAFRRGHIPGALAVSYLDFAWAQKNGLTLEMPSAQELAARFARIGIGPATRVILYQGGAATAPVARTYVALDAAGLGGNVSLLDGGWAAWQAEGAATEVGSGRAPEPVAPIACAAPSVTVDLDFVERSRGAPDVTLVDARVASLFRGSATQEDLTPGHIPGAINIPYPAVFATDGKFRPPAALAALFRRRGVGDHDLVIVYCHVGREASTLYFVARMLGHDVRLYDGSWEEWSRSGEPIAVDP